MCNNECVPTESTRARSMAETRTRILDVSLDVLGRNPDAGMGEIATAAGVVRRTVYGHFPSRTDLIRSLTQRAADEIAAVLAGADATAGPADAAWAEFIARLWPLTNRYRVLLALRRGEYGAEIHSLLVPVDATLAALVQRGQDYGVFARHVPADILSQVAFSTVFTLADRTPSSDAEGSRAAAITSLLLLGVPQARAQELASD